MRCLAVLEAVILLLKCPGKKTKSWDVNWHLLCLQNLTLSKTHIFMSNFVNRLLLMHWSNFSDVTTINYRRFGFMKQQEFIEKENYLQTFVIYHYMYVKLVGSK